MKVREHRFHQIIWRVVKDGNHRLHNSPTPYISNMRIFEHPLVFIFGLGSSGSFQLDDSALVSTS